MGWEIPLFSISSKRKTIQIYSLKFRYRRDPENFDILVGTNTLSSGGPRYKVNQIIQHEDYFMPEYGKPDIHYDIALLQMQTPIPFTAKVQPIKYSLEEVEEGEILTTFGWGNVKVL